MWISSSYLKRSEWYQNLIARKLQCVRNQDNMTAPMSHDYNDSGIVEDEELDDEEMTGEDLTDSAIHQ
jgi:hypothetical protein